jgi:putative two-component system response regulator
MIRDIRDLDCVKPVINGHHENWDGSGYPNGLWDHDIPLPARIMRVVDVYDALTTRRSYAPIWPRNKALDYIDDNRGKLFDPAIAQTFIEMMRI